MVSCSTAKWKWLLIMSTHETIPKTTLSECSFVILFKEKNQLPEGRLIKAPLSKALHLCTTHQLPNPVLDLAIKTLLQAQTRTMKDIFLSRNVKRVLPFFPFKIRLKLIFQEIQLVMDIMSECLVWG